jgi:DNA-binding XRE family transcriptional regulator
VTVIATYLPTGRTVRVVGLSGPGVVDLVVLPRADYRSLAAAAVETPGVATVRDWRLRRGLGARALARAAGVDPGYLSQIETGRKPGSVKALRALAAALGVPLDAVRSIRRD